MNTTLNLYNQCIKRSGSELNNYKKTIFFKGLIEEIDDKLQSIDSKYLLTTENMAQGAEISNNNINYLVMTKNEKVNNTYYKYTIQKCPYYVNFVPLGIIQRIPCIIQTKTLDVQTNESIILSEGKIIITISANSTTDKIAINDRFITMGSAWKISGLDKSCEGLIKVNADKDQVMSGDDLINETISGAVKPSYTFNISPSPVNMKKDQTQQLNVIVSQNGTKIENTTLLYASSDTSIATISSNTGLVTGIGVGNATINITYVGDYDTADTSINVEVKEEAAHNYILSVSPENISLDTGSTQQITVSVTDKGIVINNPNITYSSDNTSVATISNTGLVTVISVGSCNITVNFVGEDGNIYSKTIPITINAATVKTVKFTSDSDTPNEILQGDTQNYSVHEYSNNNEVSDTFTIVAGKSTQYASSNFDNSYYTLTIKDGNNFSITNLKGDGTQYLTITATSKTDPSITGTITIRLKGEW